MNTEAIIRKACIGKPNEKNMKSIVVALDTYGDKFGLLVPHRLAQFLPQLMHESAEFRYDGEIWGPTAAQNRYEDRADLGHSTAVSGEAFMFRGRSGIQLTGRRNYVWFRDWCRKNGFDCPDFEKFPDKVNEDPWEGLAPIWYWSVGNPEGKTLNRYADMGDVEMITRRINGGLNGYADRLKYLTRVSLVILEYDPTDVRGFQRSAGLDIDGAVGPQTRAAMHKALLRLSNTKTAETRAAPVTVDKEVPVAPAPIDKPVTQTTGFWERITSIVGLGGIGGAAAFLQDWRIIVALAGSLIVLAIVGLFLHKRIIDMVKTAKAELGNA